MDSPMASTVFNGIFMWRGIGCFFGLHRSSERKTPALQLVDAACPPGAILLQSWEHPLSQKRAENCGDL